MKITKRFLITLLLGTFVIGISIFFHLFAEAFIFYNTLLLCLTAIDYIITPTKKSFEVERIGDRKLSLLEQEKLQVRIHNKSGYEAFIEVMQELPTAFVCEDEILKDKISPYSYKEFQWIISPNKRGAFMLEDIYIRQKGRLGLIQKDVLLTCSAEYKIYPSLKNLKKYHMMLRKEHFLSSENHITKKKSDGKEFESLREYVKGDDVRKINWIKSARESKLIVNQYEPENNKHIYILLDTGRTMSYRVNEYSKLDLAINACVFLSDVVCYNKDRSGLLVFNTKVDRFIKPSKGDFHRNQILESLYHVEGTKQTSNFDEVLFYLSHQEKRRSLICMFTDINTLQEVYYIEKGIEYITKKHHLLIFLVKDEKMDKAIHLNMKDEKDAFLKGTAYKMMDERKKIIQSLNKRGVTCIECDRENIVYKAVDEYMKAKNREIM